MLSRRSQTPSPSTTRSCDNTSCQGLLRLLASNRHHDLPQSVYELGTVVRDHRNADRLAFLTAERSEDLQLFVGAYRPCATTLAYPNGG